MEISLESTLPSALRNSFTKRTKREELSLRPIFALPSASVKGFTDIIILWTPGAPFSSSVPPDTANLPELETIVVTELLRLPSLSEMVVQK